MTQGKKITILGEEVTIAFNMAVEIEYEELSDSAFDISAFVSGKTKAALQLAAAAVTANNPQSSITYDPIIHEITPDEVKLMTTVAIGFCSGLETELFKDTDKSDGSIRQ